MVVRLDKFAFIVLFLIHASLLAHHGIECDLTLSALGPNDILVDSNQVFAQSGPDGIPSETTKLSSLILQAQSEAGVRHRYTDSVAPELRERFKNNGVTVSLSVDRQSAQYQELLRELERLNVGRGPGHTDRQIVADAFFAKTESPDIIPTLQTSDEYIAKTLYWHSIGRPIVPRSGQRLIDRNEIPVAFPVTLQGRTINIVFIFRPKPS